MNGRVITERIIAHLSALVACDSQNPPRALSATSPMFSYIQDQLGANFEFDLIDHGDGHVTLLAERGRTTTLFNCHLDTVPAGAGWSHSPLELIVRNERAYGRGSCDIKGAAAVLIALSQASEAPMALLFTTDEEGAGGCCVQRFLESSHAQRYERVVVCEPTACRAVLSHRGFLSVKGQFFGAAGHSSESRALTDNAIHRFANWLAAALTYCSAEAEAGRETCFNVGTVDGGIKSNVIADHLDVHWSARLLPGQDNQQLLETLKGLSSPADAEWLVPFSGPSFPSSCVDSESARQWMNQHRVPMIEAVDFWTEASLFSAAGKDAVVLGPGHIEQAHTVDEWVAIDQLNEAIEVYARLLAEPQQDD